MREFCPHGEVPVPDTLCAEAFYYLEGTEIGNDGNNGITDTVVEKNERRRHQAFSSIFFGTSL